MPRRAERGQILVIGAFAMIALIGITALVVDLGFVWMLRRDEQNAVDPAAIGAARHVDGTQLEREQAACFYAQQNGFFEGDANCAGALGSGELQVNMPPSGGDHAGEMGFVEVVIEQDHETFFSQIFGFDTMTVTTGAVAANADGAASGNTLVALDPSSCGAGLIRGTGAVNIYPVGAGTIGGTVYVNSDGSGPPPASSCVGAYNDACGGSNGGMRFEGANSLLVTPHLYVRGTCGNNANIYPANCIVPPCGLSEGAPPITDPLSALVTAPPAAPAPSGTSSTGTLSLDNCDSVNDTGCSFTTGSVAWYELNPGVYYGGWTISREVRLNPGIYYIAGGGVQMSGQGRLVTNGASKADGTGGILIYSTDGPNCASGGGRRCQGTITLEGLGGFQARALNQGSDLDGLLIWQDGNGSRAQTASLTDDLIRIAGSGEMNFWGTIYAPRSRVQIEGNGIGTSTAGVQVLAWQFDIAGNGTLNMPYDPARLFGVKIKGLVE